MVSLFGAFVLGTLIGAERQYRQRGGGLRTHVLVAVSAATFVDIGMHLNGNQGAAIIAYVVSGVGFIERRIMKQGSNVWGLNTRGDAVVLGRGRRLHRRRSGVQSHSADRICARRQCACCRPLVAPSTGRRSTRAAPKRSMKFASGTGAEDRDASRDFLREQLEAASYPLQDIEIVDENDDEIEFVATLGTGANPDGLDAIVKRLKSNPTVQNASWSICGRRNDLMWLCWRGNGGIESTMEARKPRAMFNGERDRVWWRPVRFQRDKKPNRDASSEMSLTEQVIPVERGFSPRAPSARPWHKEVGVELDHVSAGYTGRYAFIDVTGRFAPGSLTAVVGPNGAGKSSLLKAIAGTLRLQSGTVDAQHAGRTISRICRSRPSLSARSRSKSAS